MGHKGTFGHVLVIGGAPGKTGAAAMTGMAALRAGAGLVTVASAPEALPVIAAHAPELMTEPLPPSVDGKTVLAVGPGMGVGSEQSSLLRDVLPQIDVPMVLDADALNNLAGIDLPRDRRIVLTPHPGEMARLCGRSAGEIQEDRIGIARAFVREKGVALVLKGYRTVIAFPDGSVWINPTGGPAMATGGSGDILTGLIAGLVAQFPDQWQLAIVAAVWMHGRAGDLAAAELGEKCVIATDLLRFLPAAMIRSLATD
jgi:NAD(P)H-hydrate epimerase